MSFQPKILSAVSASSFGPGGILSMADGGMTRKESPADFVSAFGTITPDRLRDVFAFWFLNNNGKIIPAPRTGSGKVNSHSFNLALPLGPLNTGVSDQVRVLVSASTLCRRTRCSSKHWAVLA